MERKQTGETLSKKWIGHLLIEVGTAAGEILGINLIELDAVGGEANAAVAEVRYIDGTGAADLAGDGEVPLLDVAIGLIAQDDVGVVAEPESAVVHTIGGAGADDAVRKWITEGGLGRVVGIEDIGYNVVVEWRGDDGGFKTDGEIKNTVATADSGAVIEPVGEAEAGADVAPIGFANGARVLATGE